MKTSMGRIVGFDFGTYTAIGVTTGISGDKQAYYDNNPYYAGSNGTYATSFTSLGSYLKVRISVYEDNNHVHEIEIRDEVLAHNGMKKVSSKLMDYLEDNNTGKKIKLVNNNGSWGIDISQLDIDYK